MAEKGEPCDTWSKVVLYFTDKKKEHDNGADERDGPAAQRLDPKILQRFRIGVETFQHVQNGH